MFQLLKIFLILSQISRIYAHTNPPEFSHHIQLADGSRMTGLTIHLALPNLPQVRAYYGVRYASLGGRMSRDRRAGGPNRATKSTASPHRFSHSVASFFYESPKGVQVKTVQPPVCPQPRLDSRWMHRELLAVERERLQRIAPFLNRQSEDCLTLNIYAPYSDKMTDRREPMPQRPVVLFVHGESFERGTGNAYDLSVLAAYTGAICITLNYRLGILGFLTLNDGQSHGNFALFDLRAAILWIRANIDRFGGNPDQMVLMGYGHGAALVHLFSMSKLAQGFGSKGIKRLIILNGFGLSPLAGADFHHNILDELSKQLNLTTPNTTRSSHSPEATKPYLDKFSKNPASKGTTTPSSLSSPIGMGASKVDVNTTVNVTKPGPTIAEQVLKHLKQMTYQKVLKHQSTLSNLSTCTNRFGPAFSRHLYPEFVYKDYQTPPHHSQQTKQSKTVQITQTLFAKSDLLVGLVGKPASQMFRHSEWSDESIRGSLARCMQFVFPVDGAVVAEILNFLYGNTNDGRNGGYNVGGEKNNLDGEKRLEKLLAILSDGFFQSPAIQTLRLHELLQNIPRKHKTRSASTTSAYLTMFQRHPFTQPTTTEGMESLLSAPKVTRSSPREITFGHDLAYWLGAPLMSPNRLDPFGDNFSKEDGALSERMLYYLRNFIHIGNPNGNTVLQSGLASSPFWPEYMTQSQAYLSVDPLARTLEWDSNRPLSDAPFQIAHISRNTHLSVWSELLPRIAGFPKLPANEQNPKLKHLGSNSQSTLVKMNLTVCPEPASLQDSWSPNPDGLQSQLYAFHLRDRRRQRFDAGETVTGNYTEWRSTFDYLAKMEREFQLEVLEHVTRHEDKNGTDARYGYMVDEQIPYSMMQASPIGPNKMKQLSSFGSLQRSRPTMQSMTTDRALLWTIAAGLILFLLNGLVFFGIYYQVHRLRSDQLFEPGRPMNTGDYLQGDVESSRRRLEGRGEAKVSKPQVDCLPTFRRKNKRQTQPLDPVVGANDKAQRTPVYPPEPTDAHHTARVSMDGTVQLVPGNATLRMHDSRDGAQCHPPLDTRVQSNWSHQWTTSQINRDEQQTVSHNPLLGPVHPQSYYNSYQAY